LGWKGDESVNPDKHSAKSLRFASRENAELRTAGDTEKQHDEAAQRLFVEFKLVMDFRGHRRT